MRLHRLMLLWRAIRNRGDVFDRFTALFAFIVCSIPLLDYVFHFALLPQPRRYHLDLEMACRLAGAFALWRVKVIWRRVALAALVVLFVSQTILCRRYARQLTEPARITSTIEYRAAQFLDRHLHGARAMVSGDAVYWANLFFDFPQFSGGHEPSAPNWMQLVAVFTIYSGMNTGPQDADVSVFWPRPL